MGPGKLLLQCLLAPESLSVLSFGLLLPLLVIGLGPPEGLPSCPAGLSGKDPAGGWAWLLCLCKGLVCHAGVGSRHSIEAGLTPLTIQLQMWRKKECAPSKQSQWESAGEKMMSRRSETDRFQRQRRSKSRSMTYGGQKLHCRQSRASPVARRADPPEIWTGRLLVAIC